MTHCHLDVVARVARPRAPGPVELAGVHGRLDDGHDGFALQLHVGFEQLKNGGKNRNQSNSRILQNFFSDDLSSNWLNSVIIF